MSACQVRQSRGRGKLQLRRQAIAMTHVITNIFPPESLQPPIFNTGFSLPIQPTTEKHHTTNCTFTTTMSAKIPTSTSVSESAVIEAPFSDVWSVVQCTSCM